MRGVGRGVHVIEICPGLSERIGRWRIGILVHELHVSIRTRPLSGQVNAHAAEHDSEVIHHPRRTGEKKG